MKKVLKAIIQEIEKIQALHRIKACTKQDYINLAILVEFVEKIKITNPKPFKS